MHFRSQQLTFSLKRNFHDFIMGDLCTAERFHQALRDINLASSNYGINESFVESPALENRAVEDLTTNYRLKT
jgi:hypothetical protein